jgi:5-methylcytosine-specific restriction endonuclease McrA
MTVRYSPLPVFGFVLDNHTLHQRQSRRCYLCGFKMQRGLTRDHVWPKAAGGRDAGNILLAHARCNGSKGDRLPYPCELIYRDAIYQQGPVRPVAVAA